jgi:hypothetical protein
MRIMTLNIRSVAAGCAVLLTVSSRTARGFVANSAAHSGRGLFGVVTTTTTTATTAAPIADRRRNQQVPGVVNFYGDLVRYVFRSQRNVAISVNGRQAWTLDGSGSCDFTHLLVVVVVVPLAGTRCSWRRARSSPKRPGPVSGPLAAAAAPPPQTSKG